MSKTISISQFQMNATMSFIMISIVNLFISFITAEHVYSGNTLVPYSVILVSTFVGLEVLLYLFVVPLSELVDSWDRKRKGITAVKSFVTELPVAEEAKTEMPASQSPAVVEEFVAPSTVTEEGKEPTPVITPSAPVVETRKEKPVDADIQAIYNRSDAENRAMEMKIKEKMTELIKIYVGEVMAPLLAEEDIEFFWLEFESWIENSKYHPKGRRWKWKKDVTSYDVRHLVWNIGKRMGMDKGYNVIVCAAFTKMMFPDICENVKESTLSQTMKVNPDKGHIKIDEPEPNCPFKFHTDTEQE